MTIVTTAADRSPNGHLCTLRSSQAWLELCHSRRCLKRASDGLLAIFAAAQKWCHPSRLLGTTSARLRVLVSALTAGKSIPRLFVAPEFSCAGSELFRSEPSIGDSGAGSRISRLNGIHQHRHIPFAIEAFTADVLVEAPLFSAKCAGKCFQHC